MTPEILRNERERDRRQAADYAANLLGKIADGTYTLISDTPSTRIVDLDLAVLGDNLKVLREQAAD